MKSLSMNPRIKRLWVNALRSGKYSQGTERLRGVDNTFCCLGVLCDLYAAEETDARWEQPKLGSYHFLGESKILPRAVRKWAGLSLSGGAGLVYLPPPINRTLGSVNDMGKSFDEIADIIENNL